MRLILSVATAVSLFAAAACSPEAGQAPAEVAPILTSEQAQDEYSFAQPQVARVTHVSLDLSLDFAAKEIGGTATLDVLAAEALEYMESPQSSFGELFAAYLSDDVAEPDQDSTG